MEELIARGIYAAMGVYSPVVRKDYIIGNCPFALYNHVTQEDRHPSFNISLTENFFRCWSCGAKGPIDELVMQLKMQRKLTGIDIPEHWDLSQILHLSASSGDVITSLPSVEYEDVIGSKQNKDIVFPERWLNSFRRVNHPYALDRLSGSVCNKLDIRFDFSKSRVCFPIRDFAGRLVGLQGRLTNNEGLRYYLYKYKGKNNNKFWGNECNVNLDAPVVLTEGFFDLGVILEGTPNTLCSLTSSINKKQLSRILDGDLFISAYDFGTGGNTARKILDKWAERNNKQIYHYIPPEGLGDCGNMDPIELRNELRRAVKWL